MSATWSLVWLVLLGCPSDDGVVGDASGSRGSSSGGAQSSSGVSATGMIPPATTSTSSSSGADGTSTGVSSSGGEDFGASDEGVSCAQCCGNGIINGTEQCDCGEDFCTPEGLGFNMCLGQTTIFPTGEIRHYTGGILNCNMASCQFDYTQCTFCGDGAINGNEVCEPRMPPDQTCASLGLGDATEPLPCAPDCQIDVQSCQ